MTDLAKLKALAEAATPGEWHVDRERQDDSLDKHYEFAVFDAS